MSNHNDEYGRPMDESVTVTLTRSEWWLARNQLRNMADDWRRSHQDVMASKCAALADKIDRVVLAAPDKTKL